MWRRRLGWLCALLSIAPLLQFAYMGSMSRMIYDDYRHLSDTYAQSDTLWQTILYWRERWTGSYSRFFVIEWLKALAPHDLVALFPALLLAALLLCATALLLAARPIFSLRHVTGWQAMVLAALWVAASINALPSMQSFYWFTASLVYTLPVALFLLNLALLLAAGSLIDSRWKLVMMSIAGACFTFFIGGFAEITVTSLLAVLSCLLAISLARSPRHALLGVNLFLILGCLGALASAVVQVTAPGTQARSELISSAVSAPVQHLPELLTRSADSTFQYIGNQAAIAGFALLFSCSFALALFSESHTPSPSAANKPSSLVLPQRPVWISLAVQLLFLPILWTHMSDSPQLLGRFSTGFAIVVALNLLAIGGLLAWIWRWRGFESALRVKPGRWRLYAAGILLLCLLLFALTQFRSIHFKAANSLFITALCGLGILFSHLQASFGSARTLQLGRAGLLGLLVAALVTGAVVVVSLYGAGHVRARTMVPTPFMLVLSGLLWGAGIGYLLKDCFIQTANSTRSVRLFAVLALLTLVIIVLAMMLGQAGFIPKLQSYAQEWDQRHEYILQLVEAGERSVVTEPLSFDLSYYLTKQNFSTEFESALARAYYGLDSLTQGDTNDA